MVRVGKVLIWVIDKLVKWDILIFVDHQILLTEREFHFEDEISVENGLVEGGFFIQSLSSQDVKYLSTLFSQRLFLNIHMCQLISRSFKISISSK